MTIVPLPDVDGALAEAAHALDVLHADGVMVLSNAHGRHLGDPAFEPLWAELDARSAVVLIHPTAPPGAPVPELPPPPADFPYDTTRAALHMAVRGVPRRYPRMRLALPHAGGFLPHAAHRFALAARLPTGATSDGPGGTPEDWGSGFDTALDEYPHWEPGRLHAVNRGNAELLIPRLAHASA
ncbi:amidohydrolase family protein [Streptomyces adelaidensis]|uniref:amidohydrolase family protein n=1 Tax=Streptomyces adelaidensis TaxID=2796465 RepID=UPI0027DE72A5|nr:amidohydrolase family protein [Streptomyces adelaidensis]